RNKYVTKFLVDPFDGDNLEREAFGELSDGSVVGSDDPRDYRWVVDFESPDFYGQKIAFDEKSIAYRVQIPRGQFYTASRTTQCYERVTVQRRGRPFPLSQGAGLPEGGYASGRQYIGRIARVIGANIQLDDDETPVLRVGTHCPPGWYACDDTEWNLFEFRKE